MVRQVCLATSVTRNSGQSDRRLGGLSDPPRKNLSADSGLTYQEPRQLACSCTESAVPAARAKRGIAAKTRLKSTLRVTSLPKPAPRFAGVGCVPTSLHAQAAHEVEPNADSVSLWKDEYSDQGSLNPQEGK